MKRNRQKLVWLTTLMAVYSLVAAILGGCAGYAGELPQIGNRYRVIDRLYMVGVYNNGADRRNNKMSIISIVPFRISGPEVAFVRLVPVGAIMIVVGPAPKLLPLPFYEDRFFVRFEPADLTSEFPSDLPMIIGLSRGIEGSLDGLNPKIFSRVE